MSAQDNLTKEVKLNETMRVALSECAGWTHQPYTWRPASMKKLEALGLVSQDDTMYCRKLSYTVTDKGREWLANNT